jgi:type III secretion system low calcium response chaperone LcrH/SycD
MSNASNQGTIDDAAALSAVARGQVALPLLQAMTEQTRISHQEAKSLYALGFGLYEQARYTDAGIVFLYLMLHAAPEARHYMGLAACHQAEKEFARALQLYQACILLDPVGPHAHFHSGECLLHLGRKEEALQALGRAASHCQGSDKFSSLLNKASGLMVLIHIAAKCATSPSDISHWTAPPAASPDKRK